MHSISGWQMDRQTTNGQPDDPKTQCFLPTVVGDTWHARISLTGNDMLLMQYSNNSIKTHTRPRHHKGSNYVSKYSKMSDICCSYVIIRNQHCACRSRCSSSSSSSRNSSSGSISSSRRCWCWDAREQIEMGSCEIVMYWRTLTTFVQFGTVRVGHPAGHTLIHLL